MKENVKWPHLLFRILFIAVIVALVLLLVAVYFVDRYQLTAWQAPISTTLSVLQVLILVLLVLRLAYAGYEKFRATKDGDGTADR